LALGIQSATGKTVTQNNHSQHVLRTRIASKLFFEALKDPKITSMASIFADFHEAQRVGSGHLLASCLAPIDNPQNPRRLQSFAQLSNYQTISADVRYHLLQERSAVKLPKAEGNAWVEIFVALWSAVKELLATEHSLPQASWSKAFEAYKEVCNLVIRGYSNHGFQAWTVPCLYVTGKYLRLFAVKADAEAKSKETITFGNGFSDDVVGNFGKNEKLEQAAWVINRMFTICLSDRYGSTTLSATSQCRGLKW
jgi:hypothetical protein